MKKAMTKIKISQLEMLVSVVDSGSFSSASVELGCTQSRISHGISELEERVGTKLLVRSRNGCMPTAAGHQVLDKARQMLKFAEDIGQVARPPSEIEGTVRLACIRSVGMHLLPSVIEAMSEGCSRVHLEINDGCHDYDEVSALVQSDQADIGITREPVHPDLVAYPLVCDPYVVIAPASADLRSPVCWNELSRLPFIQIQQPGAMWIVDKCREVGFVPKSVRRVASEIGALALVSRGLGYLLLPRLASFPDTPATKVLELPHSFTRYLTVCVKPSLARTTLAKTVLSYLLDQRLIAQSAAWRAGVIRFSA